MFYIHLELLIDFYKWRYDTNKMYKLLIFTPTADKIIEKIVDTSV